MRFKTKSIVMTGFAALCAAAAALSGGLMTSGDSSRWTSHADVSWYDELAPSYTIDTPAKLAGVAKLVNDGETEDGVDINGFEGKVFDIDRNMDLKDYLWVPIGTPEEPFKGTMYAKDGAVYTISGMKLAPETDYAGLIGYMEGGTLGGFIFKGDGTFNLHNSWQDLYAGVAVGKMTGNSTVYNITNYLPIEAGSPDASVYAGGIVGSGDGTISNSVNHADITANGTSVYAGGIAGYTEGDQLIVKKTTNNGEILGRGLEEAAGEIHAGGIIGNSDSALYMDDEATPIANTGTIMAQNGVHAYAGGIIAKAENEVSLSIQTANSGQVSVNAAKASGTYAGGLVGAITAEQTNPLYGVVFNNTGTVTNNGGAGVYTGGIAGYVGSDLEWSQSYEQQADVAASGASNVNTGGLIGYIKGDLSFQSQAKNSSDVTVTGAPDEAYTGGLIGFAASSLNLLSPDDESYVNAGPIAVNGGEGVYTGGITGNREYQDGAGEPAANVASKADITVNGVAKLYTGGYIGMLVDGDARKVAGAEFNNAINVQAAESDAERPVRTGGIIGYASGASIDASVFGGQLQAAGGAFVYTGGIVGAADDSAMTNSSAGGMAEAYAKIEAEGTIGGLAGAWNGEMNNVGSQYLSLTATRNDGVAGGIAGTAQGEIAGAVVGDEAYEGNDSVRFAAAAGVERLTAGGIVGNNDGELRLASGQATKLTLANEAGRTGYIMGGIAGFLTEQAALGTSEAPVLASGIEIAANADNSVFGGVAGVTNAPVMFVQAEAIDLTVAGADVKAGIIAGQNDGVIRSEDSQIEATNSKITAMGAAAVIGGIVGENNGEVPASLSQEITIESNGEASLIGGTAGRNTGTLSNSSVQELALTVKGKLSSAGGVAGLSEPLGESVPVIQGPKVQSELAILLTVEATDVNAGGIVGYAKETQIIAPAVTAEDGANVLISLKGATPAAGGLAGRMTGGLIEGDTTGQHVQNLLLSTSVTATDAVVGGLVGYNDQAKLNQITGNKVNLLLNGSKALAGGMTGYNRGTDTAIISNVYLSGLYIRANASADASTVGGFVGINDKRVSETGDPAQAVSTIQKSRYIGTIGSSSPALLIQAPNAVVGGMVGENRSFIANNSIPDKVQFNLTGATATIGGLVGRNTADGILYYTYANTSMNIQGNGTLAGGLVGVNNGQVLSSYTEADLTGKAVGANGQYVALGGLVGKNAGKIAKSYTSAAVTATGAYSVVGGLIGEQTTGTTSDAYVIKNVAATNANSYAGGIVGRLTGGTIQNVYSAAEVKAEGGAYAGGFAGRYDNASKELLTKAFYVMDEANNINADLPDFADGNHKWMNSAPRLRTVTLQDLKDRSAFPATSGWDFDSVWKYGSTFAQFQNPELIRTANVGGSSGGSDVNANINWYMRDQDAVSYELHSEAELAGLAAIVNGEVPGLPAFDFAGRKITIAGPIHMQSAQWVPIGLDDEHPFEGMLDGGNYLIDGLKIVPDYDYSGLFGYIGEGGEVRNMRLEPLTIEGKNFTGVLAGYNQGQLAQITIELSDTAVVSGGITGSFLGGNEGQFTGVTVSLASGARMEGVKEGAVAGGLIGYNASELTADMFNFPMTTGNVVSSANKAVVGGLIGWQAADASGLHADIVAGYRIAADGDGSTLGGLFGKFESGLADGLSVTFTTGTLNAPGAGSVLGGIIGDSDAGNRIVNAKVTAVQSGLHLSGNGVVGGIVGDKTGTGSAAYDLEQAVVDAKVNIGSPEGSSNSVLGGIAGRLTDAAMRDSSSAANIDVRGSDAAAGGIVGQSMNSILVDVISSSKVTAVLSGGEGAIGGIAGILQSNDSDRPYDFGLWAPLYHGMYDSAVKGGTVTATGAPSLAADMYAGGLVGKNLHASIYQSSSDAAVTVKGAKLAVAGGLAGYNDGYLVRDTATGKTEADGSALYRVGGVIGWTEGGGIHYTKLTVPASSVLKVGTALAKDGVVPAAQVGGFVGASNETAITYASTDIAVDVQSVNADSAIDAGGFAGQLGDSASGAAMLSNAFAKGKVTVNGTGSVSVGGFAGSADQYQISAAYASGIVSGKGNVVYTGGFVGNAGSAAVIDQVYAIPAKVESTGVGIAMKAYTGGIAGYNDGAISGSYAGTTVITNNATGTNVKTGALVGYQFRDGKLTNNTHASALTAVGKESGTTSGSANSVIVDPLAAMDWDYGYDTYFLTEPNNGEVAIDTVQKLRGAIRLYNDATGLTYYSLYNRQATENLAMPKLLLGADLNLTNLTITPFDHFDDVFDGQGHKITGFAQTITDAQPRSAGFFVENDGEITNVSLLDFTIKGGTTTGLVTGVNHADGNIHNVNVRGRVEGLNGGFGVFGGIAGSNEGTIAQSYARGTVTEISESKTIEAGGIAGVNAGSGTIADSFSFADVTAAGSNVKTGGITGTNEGTIHDAFNSGLVRADGQVTAHAGGIAGFAAAGSIDNSLNSGEAVAGAKGKITTGAAFFGGIAGQKASAASITDSAFNKQMLKRNTAYYDNDGSRVTGASIGAQGLTVSVLTGGTLPSQLPGGHWYAAAGFYPRLNVFANDPAAALGAAAVMFNGTDTVNRVESSFGLTRNAAITWSAGSGVSISTKNNVTTGKVQTGASAKVAASANGELRFISIQPAWSFAETALAPTIVSGEATFTEQVSVVLKTDEQDGRIYYTTDGSRPTEDAQLYTAPIALNRTATVKAVTIHDGKEDSALLSATFTKAGTVSSGGGGVAIIIPPVVEEPVPAIEVKAGGHVTSGSSDQPVAIAKNGKLKLTASAGQTIYYTTDGSEPTKNSPVYDGDLVITKDMTVKAITDQDDTVITLEFQVEKAKYDLKQAAGEVNYMNGYNDGTFKPNADMTRLTLIQALAPLLDKEDVELASTFSDVSGNEQDQVAFFASAGIVEGYPNGTFGGDNTLTRAEMTVIMARVLKLDISNTGKTTLKDMSGHWAEKYVNAFTAAGYVKGFPDGTFKPEARISRAEAIVIINRIVGTTGGSGSVSYSDLPANHWAYKEIMAAVQ
ncbi:hypothetical protein FHS18_006033 [Paenibacillus phyllosphaerae]|uniref:SLH domain-containing protein n=1 Tax=Paenibacillus phyllosphaerae TaxID=274593 RepID=A0A7W5B401_9BACL|nr:chitobiase/beta-hexosaminidase C-terminal domain-containing protein [Paenibacillus phyllosphaerae]MBB3113918.1 hypothetical protein [Paenibacillus phyllosphaerae]